MLSQTGDPDVRGSPWENTLVESIPADNFCQLRWAFLALAKLHGSPPQV